MTKQIIIPMVDYEDGIKAMEWLTNAFGFREKTRHLAPDGSLSHGEIELSGSIIMLASPTPDYQSPRKHRKFCETARKLSEYPWVIDGILVVVENIDAHFQVAKDAGATILTSIEDQPFGRLYRAEDLEGHRWMFLQR